MRGYFGIGIENTKTPMNVGTLWRSAQCLGADFIFTIGRRYKKQSSDTLKTWRHLPLFHFATFEEFQAARPYDCLLVGVELDERAQPLESYIHPERAVYLLGAEDHGLTKTALKACNHLVQFTSERCLNVAAAGTVVLYDRQAKAATA